MLRLLVAFNSRRPRARWLLSIVGIALGVALGYAVHLVNRAAVDDVAAAVRSVAGEADLEVRIYPAHTRATIEREPVDPWGKSRRDFATEHIGMKRVL